MSLLTEHSTYRPLDEQGVREDVEFAKKYWQKKQPPVLTEEDFSKGVSWAKIGIPAPAHSLFKPFIHEYGRDSEVGLKITEAQS